MVTVVRAKPENSMAPYECFNCIVYQVSGRQGVGRLDIVSFLGPGGHVVMVVLPASGLLYDGERYYYYAEA